MCTADRSRSRGDAGEWKGAFTNRESEGCWFPVARIVMALDVASLHAIPSSFSPQSSWLSELEAGTCGVSCMRVAFFFVSSVESCMQLSSCYRPGR